METTKQILVSRNIGSGIAALNQPLFQLVCIFYPAGSVLTSVIVAFLQIAVTYRTDRIKNTVMYIALAVFTAGIMQITENVFSGLMFSCCLIASPYVVRLIKKYLSIGF